MVALPPSYSLHLVPAPCTFVTCPDGYSPWIVSAFRQKLGQNVCTTSNRMHLLLLSHDIETVTAFRRSSGEMGVHLYLCEEAHDARSALREHQYDAIAIDCDDTHAGRSVLKSVRQARANRATVVLAILNGDTQGADAIDMGANFVLNKPVSCDAARQELLRLRELMGKDQRQYPRCPAEGTVYVSFGRTIDCRAELVNLAMGGIGIRMRERVQDDEIVRLRFQVPGTTSVIQAQGEIVWADPQGVVGIRFISLTGNSRTALEKWIQSRTATN